MTQPALKNTPKLPVTWHSVGFGLFAGFSLIASPGCGDLLKEKKKSEVNECQPGDVDCQRCQESPQIQPTIGNGAKNYEPSFDQAPVAANLLPVKQDDSVSTSGAKAPTQDRNTLPATPYAQCRYTPQMPHHTQPGCRNQQEFPHASDLVNMAEPFRAPAEGQRCASDQEVSKNLKGEGRSEVLGVNWKLLPGLKNFEEATAACSALGPNWSIPTSEVATKLMTETGFRSPIEVNCASKFWVHSPLAPTSCQANWTGFRYVSSNGADPLPINQIIKPHDLAGQSYYAETNSVLCIEGKAKPQTSCLAAINTLFKEHPAGITDPATGNVWAKITIASFTDAKSAATQCAVGESQGWHLPTKAEVEVALKNDVFNTAAYAGKDLTCPFMWFKDEDPLKTKTCVSLGVGTDGQPQWKTDKDCITNDLNVPTNMADTGAADFRPSTAPSSTNPLPVRYGIMGVCVRGK